MIAIVVGWAGQKAYKSFVVHEKVLIEEEFTNPDGSKGSYTQTFSSRMISNAPDYTEEKAKKQYAEIQDLIAQGKGELIDVNESDSRGMIYTYKFILSDGEEIAWGSLYQIDYKGDKVVSYREIKELIAQGKGKLIEVKESDSGGKIIFIQSLDLMVSVLHLVRIHSLRQKNRSIL